MRQSTLNIRRETRNPEPAEIFENQTGQETTRFERRIMMLYYSTIQNILKKSLTLFYVKIKNNNASERVGEIRNQQRLCTMNRLN